MCVCVCVCVVCVCVCGVCVCVCVVCVCVCVCVCVGVGGVCGRVCMHAGVCVQPEIHVFFSGAKYMLCRVCTCVCSRGRANTIELNAGIWEAIIYIARKLCCES